MPTKECQSFWVTSVIVALSMIFAAIMIVIENAEPSNLPIWVGIITTGIGIFVPNPKYKNAKQTLLRNESVSQQDGQGVV